MTVRNARKVIIILCIILAVTMFTQAVTDDDPKNTSPDDIPYFVLFLCVMAGMVVFSYFYLRCPKCGRHLSRPEIRDLRCKSCGDDFNE